MIDAHLEEVLDERRYEFRSHRESVLTTLATKFNLTTIYVEEIASCIAFASLNDHYAGGFLTRVKEFSQADLYAMLNDEEGYWEEKANECL